MELKGIDTNSVALCASSVKLCVTQINYTEKHGEPLKTIR
jgi:hypothetical protein